jgi:hypothetical protein
MRHLPPDFEAAQYAQSQLCFPGTVAWRVGLLVAVNMIVGDAALIAIGIHAGTEWAAKAIPARNP